MRSLMKRSWRTGRISRFRPDDACSPSYYFPGSSPCAMVSDNLSDRRKKRRPGRPKTGVTPMTGVRLSAKLEDAIKGWAGKQEDQPTKAEAIRRLVELGLASKGGKAKG